MTETDHRALTRPGRVTIAHALHCAFARDRHSDRETLGTLLWIIRRYGMHNISQAPTAVPVGVWRVVDSIFPGDLLKSEIASVRRLAEQFRAERCADEAMDALDFVKPNGDGV